MRYFNSHKLQLFILLMVMFATSSCIGINPISSLGRSNALNDIVVASDTAHYQYYIGLDATQNGDFRHAIKSFKKAIKLQPDFYEAWIGLGHAQMESANYRKAEMAYRKAQKIIDNAEVQVFLARSMLFSGKSEEARILAENALPEHPRPDFVYELLGSAAYQNGRLELAVEFWTKSLEYNASNNNLRALLEDLKKYLKKYPNMKDVN